MTPLEPTFGHSHRTLDPRVGRAFFALGQALSAERVLIITIDGWFGDRWLGFAGKVAGAVGVRVTPDGEQRLPPPAFHPNRVLETVAFERRSDAWSPVPAPTVHDGRSSETNTRLRIIDIVGTGTLVCWWGYEPTDPSKVCLLAYWLGPDGDEGIWASGEASTGRLCIRQCVEAPGGALEMLLRRLN